jgi:ABC-type sulfate transport system, permease component
MPARWQHFDLLLTISLISVAIISLPLILLVIYGLGPFLSLKSLGGQFPSSIELTLVSSALTAGLEVLLFTHVAYFLARRGNGILEGILDVPASIPHPIVGLALVILDSPYTPTGKFLNSIGFNLFDSYVGLVAALTIVSAPIYVRGAQNIFEGIDRGPEHFARTLGANESIILLRVVIPSSWRYLLSSALTSMARAMSEFGSVAIIAYYVQGGPFNLVSPASVYIYSQYQYYFKSAISEAAVLLLISLVLVIIIRIWRTKGGAAGI